MLSFALGTDPGPHERCASPLKCGTFPDRSPPTGDAVPLASGSLAAAKVSDDVFILLSAWQILKSFCL